MSKKESDKKKAGRKSEPGPDVEDDGVVALVRLSGVVVDGHLTIPKALTKIKGVGRRLAESLLEKLDVDTKAKIGALSDDEIAALEKELEGIKDIVPSWMLNRRKDLETGGDVHNIGPELDMQLRDDINLQSKIKSYVGIRHQLKLPVRGQRTRSSFRHGSTLGVNRKKRG